MNAQFLEKGFIVLVYTNHIGYNCTDTKNAVFQFAEYISAAETIEFDVFLWFYIVFEDKLSCYKVCQGYNYPR